MSLDPSQEVSESREELTLINEPVPFTKVFLNDEDDAVSTSGSSGSSEQNLPGGEFPPVCPVPSPNRRKLRCRTSCGTVGYRGPEVIHERNLAYSERSGYGKSSDFFTLGVTAYVLLTGKKPFPQKRDFTPNQQVNYVPYR